jgi:signal transduction histidine kinase
MKTRPLGSTGLQVPVLGFGASSLGSVFRPVSLDDCVDDAISILNGAVDEAGALITRGPMPTAYGDRMMIARVFLNLITNAIRFAQEGKYPEIHISCEDGGEEWILSVSDNGVGIDPRHAERIFLIFQRLDHSKNGTGIGLAVAKKIVERHGGRIWVESIGSGHGARFLFTMPKRGE